MSKIIIKITDTSLQVLTPKCQRIQRRKFRHEARSETERIAYKEFNLVQQNILANRKTQRQNKNHLADQKSERRNQIKCYLTKEKLDKLRREKSTRKKLPSKRLEILDQIQELNNEVFSLEINFAVKKEEQKQNTIDYDNSINSKCLSTRECNIALTIKNREIIEENNLIESIKKQKVDEISKLKRRAEILEDANPILTNAITNRLDKKISERTEIIQKLNSEITSIKAKIDSAALLAAKHQIESAIAEINRQLFNASNKRFDLYLKLSTIDTIILECKLEKTYVKFAKKYSLTYTDKSEMFLLCNELHQKHLLENSNNKSGWHSQCDKFLKDKKRNCKGWDYKNEKCECDIYWFWDNSKVDFSNVSVFNIRMKEPAGEAKRNY